MAASDSESATVQVNLRFTESDVELIDAEVTRRNKEDRGLRLTRTDVIRSIVLKGLTPTGVGR